MLCTLTQGALASCFPNLDEKTGAELAGEAGLGFRVEGLGFRVGGLGFGV